MIELENIPNSGMFMLMIRFDGYKDSYQNDTRRKFLRLPDSLEKCDLPIKLEPISFSLIKSVTQGKSRASGAIQIYSFTGLNSDLYKKLHSHLREFCKDPNWWRSWDLLIAQDVEMEG